MKGQAALIAAIVCGSLAVGLVAADVAWSLTVTVEARFQGEWQVVAQEPVDDPYDYRDYPLGCAGPSLRVTVDNDRPIGADERIEVTVFNQSARRTDTLLREDVSLDAFGQRTFDVTVPASAFDDDTQDPRVIEKTAGVTVRVGDIQMFVQVCPEEAS